MDILTKIVVILSGALVVELRKSHVSAMTTTRWHLCGRVNGQLTTFAHGAANEKEIMDDHRNSPRHTTNGM